MNSLDLLQVFMGDSSTAVIRGKGIRELIHNIAEEDYLNIEEELSCICSWVEKKSQNLPYFISKDGRIAGALSMRGLLREAVECNDRERVLRKEVETLLERLGHLQQEFEMALANLFPNSTVIAQLKTIVEYQDEYDPATGKIKITGIIREGVYRHVINILRLLAELTEQGLMTTAGIDKAELLKTTIFHDLAKIQPHLEVGDVVDPKEVFEPGQLHAFRGASLARRVYHLEQDIVNLIKYHHHEERELPSDFPSHLLPMHRLFWLLDGLSAGITRRGSKVNMTVIGTLIQVKEESPHPAYNRCLKLDLCSGKVELNSPEIWASST